MSDELPPLDPELRALLDAERRAALSIAPSAVERTLARLAATGGGGPASPKPGVRERPTSWTHARVASLTLGAFALGAVGGFALHEALSERSPAPGAVVPAFRADPPDAATRPELAPAALDASVVAPDAPTIPMPVRRSPVREDEVPHDRATVETVSEEEASSTAAERALVDRARVALSLGDAHEALVALLGHERRFPEGELREERDILVIRALVRSARLDAATMRVARYRREHPEGRYRDEVDEHERALGGP